MTWEWAFEQLCNDRKVVRECHGDAYIYRRRITETEEYIFQFVRLASGRGFFEMKWKPDYDDLIATDWKLYDQK